MLRQEHVDLPHHIEHIVAKQHGANDDHENFALACSRCNAFKGPNPSGIDPESGQLVHLFNPRRHAWADHFAFRTN
ncbi:HNH endonuclease [Isosphaeraceae bacterium EP7]